VSVPGPFLPSCSPVARGSYRGSDSGIVSPMVFAVLRLMTRSSFTET
jgi:hypothetical protein